MNSLAFLLLRSLKNNLLEIVRNKKKLAMYIVFLFFLAIVIVASFLPGDTAESTPDIRWLTGAIFVYLLLFFVAAVRQGLSEGSTLFAMEDVNLLFVAPVSPRSVLLYGVARVLKTMALASVFILFQAGTLQSFGVGFGGVAILYGGYLLAAVVIQILGLVLYSLTNGRPGRKRFAKVLIALLFLPMVITAVWQFIALNGNLQAALLALLRTPAVSYTPILGWVSAGTVAFFGGDIAAGILFFSLLTALGAVLVAVIYIGKPDYYEDVLVASETAFERKREVSEGKINLEANKRVRVKATGVRGAGASAFFFKHLRETFRANRFGLWGFASLLQAGTAFLMVFVMTRAAGTDGVAQGTSKSSLAMVVLLAIAMYLQVFFIGMGRGIRETYSHYIYLVPDSPFRKILWSNGEVALKAAGEALLIFIPAGIAAGAGAALIAVSILAYTLFCFLLVGVNFLSLRFTGMDISAGLLIMLYMLGVILVMLPGVAGAVVLAVLGAALPVSVAVLCVWEIVLIIAFFWASKGVLHNCDMLVMRQLGGKC